MKPPLDPIPSDDCEITINGKTYTPHEGEWVKAIPGMQLGDFKISHKLGELQPQLAAIEGDEDEGAKRIALADDSFNDVVESLKDRIVEWNWTNDLGSPYPQPPDDPEVFRRLRPEESYYLISVMRGETTDAEKNGSKPSPTTSSGSRRRRAPK